jgi:CheY-like chemotaxis protein
MDKDITVLWIDDEASTEKFSSRLDIMAKANIKVIPVASVGAAIPALRKHKDKTDVIILDIIMPPEQTYSLEETGGGTTTGFRLLDDITKEAPAIPIIVVTIRRRKTSENGVKKHKNIVRYLEKPIATAEIVSAIKGVLR